MTNNNKTNSSPTHSLIPFLSIFLLFTLLALLNLPIIDTLWRHSFDDGTYSHAYLIPVIVMYLYFQLTKSGKLIFREKLSVISIALILLSAALLFITSNAQISLGYWVAFLALTTSCMVLLFNFSWVTIFPALFLVFIFPFWGLLVPFLQNLSIAAVTYIMGFTGIPTYVQAEFITIPAGVFEIADGCSGLRYFIVSLAISTLFIFLHIKSLKRALLFLTVAILGALITNWIRITALIMIGEYTNMESSLMEDHNTFGWYIYLPFMFLLFWWGNKLADTDIFKNNSNTPYKSTPKLTVMLVLFSTLLLSSTSVKSLFSQPEVFTDENHTQAEISPTIHFYSSIESKPLTVALANKNCTYKIFNFNGNYLDGKPSYYANSMLPKGHNLIRSEIKNGWNIAYTYSNNNQAVILYRYELDHVTYTNLSTFKVARLKKALVNINNTKLHWVYLTCESNCESVINDFVALKTGASYTK